LSACMRRVRLNIDSIVKLCRGCDVGMMRSTMGRSVNGFNYAVVCGTGRAQRAQKHADSIMQCVERFTFCTPRSRRYRAIFASQRPFPKRVPIQAHDCLVVRVPQDQSIHTHHRACVRTYVLLWDGNITKKKVNS
jgi:hypothetical protein